MRILDTGETTIMTESHEVLNRRRFVQMGAGLASLAGAAMGAGAQTAGQDSSPSTMESADGMPCRPLGRTGLKVSAISFGSYGFSNPGLLERAMDKGVNFICTAAVYQNGVAEEAIGRVMKTRRQDAVLLTGWKCTPQTSKNDLLKSLDQSLKRLQTDHVDIIKLHDVDDPADLDLSAPYEAFEEAKQAGKVRFLGLSGHGGNLEKVLAKAIASGKFHVWQCKYNFMEYQSQEKLFEEAAKKGIGVVAFKVEAGKRQDEIPGLESGQLTLRQAAARWAMTNPNISSVCVTVTNFNIIDEYYQAVTKKFGQAERDLLRKYSRAVDQSYCRYCSTCEPKCPHRVAVADIMRYAMYFKYYKMEKEAMTLYSRLPGGRRALPCLDCPGYCNQECPHRRSVRDGLVEADSLLTG